VQVTIQLPAASPHLYLRWVAWWRDVERFASGLAQEAVANVGAGPTEPAVERLLPIHIRLIEVQSREAVRRDRGEVRPELTGDPEVFLRSLDYSDKRGEWLLGLARAGLTVPRFPSELMLLRERVVAAIEEAASAPSLAGTPAHVVEGEESGSLSLIGEIDMSSLDPLVERLESALAAGHALTLDMAGVSFMDSQGLRMLIRLGRQTTERGLAPVVLLDPSDAVQRVIRVATPGGIPGVEVRDTSPK
jgi:anti-anti-sigma factor